MIEQWRGVKPNRSKAQIELLRERIFVLMDEGMTYTQIGVELHMSPQLVCYHANYYPGKYSKAASQRSTKNVR